MTRLRLWIGWALVILALTTLKPYLRVVHAAAAFVEGNSTQSAVNDPNIATTLADVTTGNLVVAVMGWSNRAQTITSITDSCGANLTQAVDAPHDSANAHTAIWYKANHEGSGSTCTFTVTLSGNNSAKNFRVAEFSGMQTSSVLAETDTTTNETGSTTPWLVLASPPTITTTDANTVLINAVAATANANPWSGATNSFTFFGTTTGAQRGMSSYRIVTSTGTYSTQQNGTTNNDPVGAIAAFRTAVGGGGSGTCLRSLLGVGC